MYTQVTKSDNFIHITFESNDHCFYRSLSKSENVLQENLFLF